MSIFPPIDLSAWPQTIEAAIAVQNLLAQQVRIRDDFSALKTVVGIDVSYNVALNLSSAFNVLMNLTYLKLQRSITARLSTPFPYIPGFLSFREVPVIMKALAQLSEKPDLLMVDGQGVAHPRRFGIAAHLGVLTNLPTIGVAKSRLVGRYQEPGESRGDRSPLWDKDQQIGTVLRNKDHTNPLFISPGHRLSQDTAVCITLQCLRKHRLPEPTRLADKLSKQRDDQIEQTVFI